jgi:uncharacterized protein with HEPN domain
MQRDLLLLGEMIEDAEQAIELVQGLSAAEVAADRMRQQALLWNFTVLGEASTQLSEELRERFVDVPWRRPARLRNRIVHGYWSVDLDVVVTTAERQLPGFLLDLRRVRQIAQAEGDGGVV